MNAIVTSDAFHQFRCNTERTKESLFASVAFFTNSPQVVAVITPTPISGFFVVNHESNAVLFNGPSTHLATSVSRVKYFCTESLINLTFVRDRSLLSEIFVEEDGSLFALYFLSSFYLFDEKPVFEVPFATIQMCLIFGP